jgi:hypothetical protein
MSSELRALSYALEPRAMRSEVPATIHHYGFRTVLPSRGLVACSSKLMAQKQKPGWLTRLFNSDQDSLVLPFGQISNFLVTAYLAQLEKSPLLKANLHDQCQVLQLQLKDRQRATSHFYATSCIQSRLRGDPVAPAHKKHLQ